jgi:anti-anti-sigma factor
MEMRDSAAVGYLVHEFHGRLDAASAEAIQQQLLSSLKSVPGHRVIDCAGLQYISSMGLRILLVAAKQASAQRVRFVVCNLTDPVRQVFDLAGFSKVIPLYPNRADAIASLGL